MSRFGAFLKALYYSLTLIAAIVGIGFDLREGTGEGFSPPGVFFSLIWGFVILFILRDLYYISKFRRAARYGKAFVFIEDGLRHWHGLELQKEQKEIEFHKALHAGIKLCEAVGKAFEIITKTKCHVCIKQYLPEADGKRSGESTIPRVETFCRGTDPRRDLPDYIRGVVHSVSDNSAFYEQTGKESVLEEGAFFSNWLPFRNNYKNTSFHETIYGKPRGSRFPVYNKIIRYASWTLPYKSTIVVPVWRKEGKGRLNAYLCIDSPKLAAFSKRFDIDLMRLIATSLHNTFVNIK